MEIVTLGKQVQTVQNLLPQGIRIPEEHTVPLVYSVRETVNHLKAIIVQIMRIVAKRSVRDDDSAGCGSKVDGAIDFFHPNSICL